MPWAFFVFVASESNGVWVGFVFRLLLQESESATQASLCVGLVPPVGATIHPRVVPPKSLESLPAARTSGCTVPSPREENHDYKRESGRKEERAGIDEEPDCRGTRNPEGQPEQEFTPSLWWFSQWGRLIIWEREFRFWFGNRSW